MLFTEHIRMMFCRSVLREVASLLLSGGVRAVLPYSVGLPQQSRAVAWLRGSNAVRDTLALLGSDTSVTPLLLSLHITCQVLCVIPCLCTPQEQLLHLSHKQ